MIAAHGVWGLTLAGFVALLKDEVHRLAPTTAGPEVR